MLNFGAKINQPQMRLSAKEAKFCALLTIFFDSREYFTSFLGVGQSNRLEMNLDLAVLLVADITKMEVKFSPSSKPIKRPS
jgi:hypothetical protein